MPDRFSALSAALAGRYRFEAVLPDGSPLLGQGGMAHVYAARDLKLGRDVAIKVLRPDLARLIGPDRFVREIRIAAGLSHPHILPLFDSGEAAGFLFYVMPRVRGETLRQRMDRSPALPLAETLRIAREVADALAYAHAADVIHRDIKPENIMLAGGHALVADFGVARSISGQERDHSGDITITGTGLAVGTVMYMSPEQRAGQKDIDGRTDLYSLGCVLYEMLTGRAPAMPAGDPADGTRSDPVIRALRVARPDLDPSFDPVLQRALAIRPDDRFANAASMATALAALDLGPRSGLRRTLLALALLIAGSVAVLQGVQWWRGRPDRAARPAWVLVADMSGTGSDTALASVLRDLVVAEFDQPSTLSMMTPAMIAEARIAAGLPDSLPLDASRARVLAERSGVGAVITGSVRSTGGKRYAVILRAMEPGSGRDLAVFTADANDSTLVARVGELGRRLRGALGERTAELAAQRPLWQVRTPSLPAYRDYLSALREANHGGIEVANQLLHEALTKDTGFASAWLALGTNYLTEGLTDSAAAAIQHARGLPDRLRDVDRYNLEALSAAALHGDRAAAIRWYDLILKTWPNCLPALNERGFQLASLGRYEEALADFDRALALVSFGNVQGQIELLNRATTLLILGRLDEARHAARLLSPRFRQFFDLLPPVAEARWPMADSVAEAVLAQPSAWIVARRQAGMTRISARIASGELAIGLGLLRNGATRTQGPETRWYQSTLLLLCEAAGLDPGEPPRGLLADSSDAGRLIGGLWAIAHGNTRGAAAAAARLAGRDSSAPQARGAGVELLQARIASHARRWREAVELLRAPAERGEHDIEDLDRIGSQALRWTLADAYEHLDRPDSAARSYDAVASAIRIPYAALAVRGVIYPFALQRAAALYARAGQTELARVRKAQLDASLQQPDTAWQSWLYR